MSRRMGGKGGWAERDKHESCGSEGAEGGWKSGELLRWVGKVAWAGECPRPKSPSGCKREPACKRTFQGDVEGDDTKMWGLLKRLLGLDGA